MFSIATQKFSVPISASSTGTYEDLRKVAVIIEPRVTSTLEFAVRNVMHHLPGWGLQIHHSTGLVRCHSNAARDLI